ncbi:transmembrane protein, putative (macronuclear) [Tetrahymena thermophila SB210]|uniref:Transmembrane protein, putative n=1 Tax=Tetrahymena thermophila (strain SB210) TaxID=312017 RepID=Q22G02_TETTS|nr:transmembrane protein, putative [Tetrahymena thermophila SB210]EAR84224.2 transmembrane protein, putative [Tetrahymena thermophila SB210]|eukprot:XP_001031887.2 transmembrane protein, putative [Tetrahymena thermophila SB210]
MTAQFKESILIRTLKVVKIAHNNAFLAMMVQIAQAVPNHIFQIIKIKYAIQLANKVENCAICNQADTCLQCNQGWDLSSDQTICLYSLCSTKGMYYDSKENTCKYYCSEGYNQQTATCSQIQKVQNLKTDIIQINNNQDKDIQQILLVEIQGNPTIIAIDSTMVVYYLYPELKPYYSISLNATSQLTYSTQNYINILLNDYLTIVRINILSNSVESYQLPIQFDAVFQQGSYLFNLNQNNNLFSFSMFNLDTAFNLTSFQIQLQQQRILQKSNNLDAVDNDQTSEDYVFELNNHFKTPEKKFQMRNLQKNQLLYVDSKGCNVYAPSNLNTTSQLITNPLIDVNLPLVQNNIYASLSTSIQSNNKMKIQKNNMIFFIEEMNTILFYNIEQQSLYYVNASNTTQISMLGTFSQGQLLCTKYVNKTINLLFLNTSSLSSGFVLPLTQNSTNQILNYDQNAVFQIYGIGALVGCQSLDQQDFILFQGQLGFQAVSLGKIIRNETLNTQENNYNFNALQNQNYESLFKIDNTFFYTFSQIGNQYTIKLLKQINQEIKQIYSFNFTNEYYFFSQAPTYQTVIFDNTKGKLIIANRNELEIVSIQQTNSYQSRNYSTYGGGKIWQMYGDIIGVYNFTSYNAICFVYQFGFNFIFFQQHQQNFQNFVDFQIDKVINIDQYLILYNDLVQRNLIFDLTQQRFFQLNIPSNSQNQTFIINSYQYLLALVQLNDSSIKLYVINGKQGVVGFDLNFYLADQEISSLFTSFQDKIYIPSNTSTAVVFQYNNGALTFSNSFFYNTDYFIYNYTHLFLLSTCKYFQSPVVTLFNTQKQINTQILFQYLNSFLFQNQFIVFYQSLPIVLYNTDVIGAISTKIYNVTSNLTLSYQIQTPMTNFQIVRTYVIYTSQSISYSYNVATNTSNSLPQYPFSTQAQIKSAFIYGSVSLLPVNFPTYNFIGIYSLNKQSYVQKVVQQGSQIPKFQPSFQNELITYDTLYSQSVFLIDALSMVQIPKWYTIDQTIYYQQKIFFTIQQTQIGYIDVKNKTAQLLIKSDNIQILYGYTVFQNQVYYAANLNNNIYLFNSTSPQPMFQIPVKIAIYFEQIVNMMIVFQQNQQVMQVYLFQTQQNLYIQISNQNLIKYKVNYYYFNSLNLVLITVDNQIGYFINYENASYFQLKLGQYQIQFQDGLFSKDNQIVTFQYTNIFLFNISVNGLQQIQIQINQQSQTCYNKQSLLTQIHFNKFVLYNSMQNTIGISFQSFNYGVQGQYIFTQEQMDLLTLVSQKSFEIYQLSTLTYLRTTLVSGLQLNPYLAVTYSNEIIIPSGNWFYVIDTSSQIFKKQVNLNKSTKINFIVFEDLNQVAQLNQNSGIIDVKNISDFSLSQQIKLKTPFTKSKYNFFSFKISSAEILVFPSKSQYHVINIQTNSYQIYNISYSCLQINKSYQFTKIYKTQQQLSGIIVQTDQYISLFYTNSSFSVLDTNLQKESSIIGVAQYPYQLEINKNLIVFQLQSNITVFQISYDSSQNIIFKQIYQYVFSNQTMQTFFINFDNNLQYLLYSSNFYTSVIDLSNNQQIAQIQNAAQYNQKIIADSNYFYLIGISNFILYDKKTLSIINSYIVNQFIYSNIFRVQYVENEYFLVFLQYGLHLIKMNYFKTSLIQAFNNLEKSQIINLKKFYNSQNALQTVQIVGFCDHTLFNVEINNLDLNMNTTQATVEIINQPTQLQTNQQHYAAQYQVQQQNKMIGLYKINFEQVSQNMSNIIVYFPNIFNGSTAIQISSSDDNMNINNLILTDSSYLNPIFSNLIFLNIQLSIQVQQQQAQQLLNPFFNLNKIIFDKVYLQLFNDTATFYVNDCLVVIIEELIIQNQNLERNQVAIQFQNVNQLIINKLNIQNLNTTSISSIISFNNINTINVNLIQIQNSRIQFNVMNFFNCSAINISQITIQNIQFTHDSIIKFIRITQLNIQSFIVSQVHNLVTTRLLNSIQDLEGGFNQNSLGNYLIEIQGCQISSFLNFQVIQIQNVGILKSTNYIQSINNQYSNQLINFNGINILECQNNLAFEIFYLIGQSITITKLFMQNVQLKFQAIYLETENQGSIGQSLFDNINLVDYSVIYLTGGQINISASNFTNIFSQNSAAIICEQSQILQIDQSYFQNVHCINQTSEKICQGGAVKLQQINRINLLSNNYNYTTSSYQGGALAIINQNNYQIVIDSSIFTSCAASYSSGGAIYFEYSQNITINNSTFINNTAQLERGGAIALQDSDLLNITNSSFYQNEAQIGGAIWYGPGDQTFKKYQKNFLSNKFISNIGLFYGQNIGSCPTQIQKVTSQGQVIFSNQIVGLSSGSTLTEKVYFNFFDEENRVLNFTNSELYPQSLKIQNERMGYFMKVINDQNPNLQILQGISLERVKDTGSFQLLLSSTYKNSQQQSVSIQSNPLVNSQQLNYNLTLIFRQCLRGELQIAKNNFIECQECGQGKYSLDLPTTQNQNNLICKSCPDQATSCQKDQIILKDGFWRDSVLSDVIYACVSDGCSEMYEGQIKRCKPGYIGTLCDSCDGNSSIWGSQYGKKGNYCEKCKNLTKQYVYFALIIIGYTFYALIYVFNMIDKKILVMKLIIFRKMELLMTSKSIYQGESFNLWIKILVHYLQILSLMSGLSIQYPSFLEISVGIFGNPSSLTLLSLDCLIKTTSYYPIWYHRIITQILSMVAQYILVNVIFLFIVLKKKHKHLKKLISKIYLKSTFIFMYIFYQPSISKVIFSGYFCTKIGNTYYLISDLNQECYDQPHIILLCSTIIPLTIIWCVVIPLIFIRKLHKIKQIKDTSLPTLVDIIYGILYKGYKNKFFYWEIIKIYEKLLLMIIINSSLDDIIKLVLIKVILLSYYAYLIAKKPHISVNNMKCEKQLMLMLNFIFLFLFFIIQESRPSQKLILIGYLLIIFCNLIALYSVISNSGTILILLNQKDTFMDKIKQKLRKSISKFQYSSKLIKFRNTNLYRTNKLWKKLLQSIREKKIFSGVSSTNFLTNNIFNIKSPNTFTNKQKSTERQYFLASSSTPYDQQLDEFDDNYFLSLDVLQQKENQVIQIQDTYRESYSSQNQLKLNTIFNNL